MHQIQYFITLSRTLNFSRAAEECHVSQPALTRAIQALEAELGGELLRRERQHSHLTELGNRMLPLMVRCYEAALAAKAVAQSVRTNEIAPLTVAVSRTVNIALLKGPLGELARCYPGVVLKVRRGSAPDITKMLRDGQAELGVAGPLGEDWERIDGWPIFTEPFELMVSRDHKLARQEGAALRDLSGEKLLIKSGCESTDDLRRQLGEIGISEQATHEVETDEDLIALLEANLGVAVVAASGPRSEALRRLRLDGVALTRTIAVYGVAGRQRSAVAGTLLNLLRAADWQAQAAA